MRILVADDSAIVRAQLGDALVKAGFEVELATDGEEAWDALKDGRIQFAILDWLMPRATGLAICQRLQQDTTAQTVYVLMLTAREGSHYITEALDAGANDYVAKPFNEAELLARVRAGCRMVDLQNRLAHAQRLKSIGQLAAGVAHEINTPIQYIGDNTRFLQDTFATLSKVLIQYERLHLASQRGAVAPGLLAAVEKTLQEADLEFLLSEAPSAIEQSLEGIEHVVKIVHAMREFAHPGSRDQLPTDLHRAIHSAISVARNEWSRVAELETEFDEALPHVPCFAGDINQALLNLIVNAAHAVGERLRQDREHAGRIVVRTRLRDDWAEVEVEDNGCGIAPEHRGKVFDPFFTTKELGKGTGQGLMIAHAAVVEKHGGTLHFETEVNRGTKFVLRLPANKSPVAATIPAELDALVETVAAHG